MGKSFQNLFFFGLIVNGLGCATPHTYPESVPGAPASAIQPGETVNMPVSDVPVAAAVATTVLVDKRRRDRDSREREVKDSTAAITIDCTVKLPDDPTDNPELCRSFQMEVVDEAGNEAGRFRFGGEARYRFAGKPGKKYRIRPVLGTNWSFTLDPDRSLSIGEHVRVQLRQKE